jgi:uncharacterized protein (TIGR02757 family)
MTLPSPRKPQITPDPEAAHIHQKLDSEYKKFCGSKNTVNDFIKHDPVQFPRRHLSHENIEITAFIAATIAWGRRDLILRSAENIFSLMGPDPFGFVMNGKWHKPSGPPAGRGISLHRTFFENDLYYFCKGFRHCYAKYGRLESLFASAPEIWQGIGLFREEMALANGGHYSKHIANPDKSACKRIHLALRWLARKAPVDLGLWKSIKPSSLYIPLDVHVARNARKIGLLNRKSNDKKAVIELTGNLRELCPQDPVKYDFVLFSWDKEG